MSELLSRITLDPEQCGGRPCIRGLRIRVSDVLELLAAGETAAEILSVWLAARMKRSTSPHAPPEPRSHRGLGFVGLLERHGPPPRILWITLGNVRNHELAEALERRWERVRGHFESGEPLVELGRSQDRG